jgi:hypothetical protein
MLGFRRGGTNFSEFLTAAGNGQFRRGDRLPASFLSCAGSIVMRTFFFVRGSEGQGFSEFPKKAWYELGWIYDRAHPVAKSSSHRANL